MKEETRFGLDFGGVIVRPADGEKPLDPAGGEDLVQPGAFEAVKQLVTAAEGRVWIVSKASRATQAATREWLGRVRFYQRTGFQAANLHFCAKRAEKRDLCLQLGITHFLDDRADVLAVLADVVPTRVQFGVSDAADGVGAAGDWSALIDQWL